MLLRPVPLFTPTTCAQFVSVLVALQADNTNTSIRDKAHQRLKELADEYVPTFPVSFENFAP